jgi:transcriptional regulator with GAF, ATPase, and Fis domain
MFCGTEQQSQHGLVGESPEIQNVRRMIDKASRYRIPVLLLGETGTGKEVVARALHDTNPRGQFVPIDCGSLVGTLMESELFGHTKGAFSGAVDNKKGLVELADGGTAFFDEIGDLPLEMQVKLLRLLQEREFRPVGSLQWRKVDLRVIAATHRDLRAEVAAGRFRQDLYYRLNVFTLHLPPLRQRHGDVRLLIQHFLDSAAAPFYPSEEVWDALLSYNWPGNVRELKHCIDRMCVMHSEGDLRMSDLPSCLVYDQRSGHSDNVVEIDNEYVVRARVAPISPVISIPDSERQAILAALENTHGDRAKAAKLLKTSRTTLYRKIKEYGIVVERPVLAVDSL